jgi:hypothetical protein
MGRFQTIENTNRPGHAFVEFASWRLAAELYRRYPDRFRILEMHPGGGMYDCLALVNAEGQVTLSINRAGSLVIANGGDEIRPWDGAWPQALLMSDDPKDCVDALCEALGWTIPNPAPASTRASVVFRFMAEFLSHTCLARHRWTWRNGYRDTSGPGRSGTAGQWFNDFPGAGESARRHDANDILKTPEYRFWFLMRPQRSEPPAVCLETTGIAFLKDGRSVDIFKAYQRHHRIWPLIMEVIPELLP